MKSKSCIIPVSLRNKEGEDNECIYRRYVRIPEKG